MGLTGCWTKFALINAKFFKEYTVIYYVQYREICSKRVQFTKDMQKGTIPKTYTMLEMMICVPCL